MLGLLQLGLAFVKRLFGAYAIRDIFINNNSPHDQAFAVADWCSRVTNYFALTVVGLDINQLVQTGLPLGQSPHRTQTLCGNPLARVAPIALGLLPAFTTTCDHS